MTATRHEGPPEVERLEELWAGPFGENYARRNSDAGAGRGPFWVGLLAAHPADRILEVGCNTGANLQWIAELVEPRNVVGVDVSANALTELRGRLPGVGAIWAIGRELPFRDAWFDLVFTTGVLIHQPEVSLADVMGEIVRVSRRYILCGEYHAPETVEVAYHGEAGALFKRDYGKLYLQAFPNLILVDSGFLSRNEGWDDVTWWLFEKAEGAAPQA